METRLDRLKIFLGTRTGRTLVFIAAVHELGAVLAFVTAWLAFAAGDQDRGSFWVMVTCLWVMIGAMRIISGVQKVQARK